MTLILWKIYPKFTINRVDNWQAWVERNPSISLYIIYCWERKNHSMIRMTTYFWTCHKLFRRADLSYTGLDYTMDVFMDLLVQLYCWRSWDNTPTQHTHNVCNNTIIVRLIWKVYHEKELWIFRIYTVLSWWFYAKWALNHQQPTF